MHRLRLGAPALIALATLFLAVTACDELTSSGGGNETETEHDAALVGQWIAVSGLITDASNSQNTHDIILQDGGMMVVTFDADGTVLMNEYDPDSGQMVDDPGTWFTDGTLLVVDWQSEPGPDTVTYAINGGYVVVNLGEEDVDFNGDGIDEVGNMVLTFADVTDSPDPDLVGSWSATSMTYTWVAHPDSSIDVIQYGVSFDLQANGDGTYAVAITYPPESGEPDENEAGLYTALEGLLWVYETGANAGPDPLALLFYQVDGTTATLMRNMDEEFDFNDDGIDEPATLTIVLAKQ